MGLKAVLENLDDLDEGVSGFYKEVDGKFVLDIEGIDDHPRVRGLVTANNTNKSKRDEYKTKVADLEAKLAEIPEGFDPEEYLTLKANAADPNDPNNKKIADEHIQSQKALYEGRIASLAKKHTEELAARDAVIAERDGYIDRSVAEAGLERALETAGADRGLLKGALAILKPSVKVQRADNGDRHAIVETDLGVIPVADFAKDWLNSDEGRFYLQKASGSSAPGNNDHRGGRVNKGDFGGDKEKRVDAIKSMFADLK